MRCPDWKTCFCLSVMILSGCASLRSGPAGIILVRGKPTAYTINVSPGAPPAVQYAAYEMQHFLRDMSGMELPVLEQPGLPPLELRMLKGGQESLRDGQAPAHLDGQSASEPPLGPEGYSLHVWKEYLSIRGGGPRGTLYGVYALLDDHLGCRWFTPEVSRIPKGDRLDIPPIDEVLPSPPLEYREPFVAEALDPDWALRNRVNGQFMELDEAHGGKVKYEGFVHTFESLLPPDEFFDTHPEFFSLIDGKRLKYRSQWCNTNPELAKVVTERVRQNMREYPEATVFSVSQNDWGNYCQCPDCTALAEKEGSQAAPILYLVNQVARGVREEFPDKLIDTLAYLYSRKPPKTMRPEPNVIVRLCSIECCFNHPFAECASEQNKAFVQDLSGWSRVCDRLWIWDYVTSFSHYLTPFPNLHVRGPNIRFLAEHNVRGIFEQDVYNTRDGELSGLSGYLNAKLLWNPEADPKQLMTEFCEGIYGEAAPHVLRYLELLEGTTVNQDLHSSCWDGPDAPYITDAFLTEADGAWNEAEVAVAHRPDVLQRVRIYRLPVDYAIMEHARFDGLAALEPAAGMPWGVRVPPALTGRIERFFRVAGSSQLKQTREHGDSIADYKAGWTRFLAAPTAQALPSMEIAGPKPGVNYSFYEGRWITLPAFAELTPAMQGIADGITLDVSPVEMSYALLFEGGFLAPETGLYCFTLVSNDGSRMTIDGQLLIDHDVRHMAVPRGNLVPLEKGYHPMTIEYFQSAGRKVLECYVEGPNMPRRLLNGDLLAHQ
ncbi:MAG: DUF4838 domain-containing protein [Candidatus Hydrogenedentes bacterium]|nr:DUF4838 domain-containing protein [Candidatus Hydrogenedentota bacterium]